MADFMGVEGCEYVKTDTCPPNLPGMNACELQGLLKGNRRCLFLKFAAVWEACGSQCPAW